MRVSLKLSFISVILTIIPIVFLSFMIINSTNKTIDLFTSKQLTTVLDGGQKIINNWIDIQQKSTNSLAKTLSSQDMVTLTNNFDKSLFLRDKESILNVIIFDADTKKILSELNQKEEKNNSLNDHNLHKINDNLFYNYHEEIKYLQFRASIQNKFNNQNLALAVNINLKNLLEALNLNKKIFLIDQSCNPLYELPPQIIQFIKSSCDKLKTNELILYKDKKSNNAKALMCKKINTLNLFILGQISAYNSNSPLFELKKNIFFAAIVLVIFSAILGLGAGLYLIYRMQSIVSATNQMTDGNFDFNFATKKTDEIGKLTESFKNLTSKLKSKNDLDENQIKTQTNLKDEALHKLKQSNEDLQQFVYVASHDLQEPLRMVSSFTQLLQEKYKDQLDEKANKYIFYAVDGANRMQRLLEDLLKFSRVTTHGLLFKDTDINECLADSIKNLKYRIEETNTIIIKNNELPVISCDQTQITLLFQNIIANAIKFTEEKEPEVIIKSENKNDHWLFSISDNGIGISEKYKSKIFVIFQRLHSRSQYQGTGLGLAISKKIVERHGGDIWFESQEGKGTTFYFTIPLQTEA